MWAGSRQTHPCREVIFSELKYCTLGTKEDKNEGDHHGGATPLVPNTIAAISDISSIKSMNIDARYHTDRPNVVGVSEPALFMLPTQVPKNHV